jgi:hypothetical protein
MEGLVHVCLLPDTEKESANHSLTPDDVLFSQAGSLWCRRHDTDRPLWAKTAAEACEGNREVFTIRLQPFDVHWLDVALRLAWRSALPEAGVSLIPRSGSLVARLRRKLACASKTGSKRELKSSAPQRFLPRLIRIMMPSIKRQASDSFSGPNQPLVKRQKSNSDLRENGALAVTSQGKAKDGSLIQSVSSYQSDVWCYAGLNIEIKIG